MYKAANDLNSSSSLFSYKQSRYSVELYRDDMYLQHQVPFPSTIRHAAPVRKAEYLFGRLCAREALRDFIPNFDSVPGIDFDRSPIWPPGLVGSITHTRNLAAAIVAPKRRVTSVGLDIEPFILPLTVGNLEKIILNRYEVEILRDLKISREAALTIVFSAKEALFKALYPITKVFFDFSDAAVCNLDLTSGCFQIQLLKSLSDIWKSGACFTGSVKLDFDHVKTLIVISADDQKTISPSWDIVDRQ